MLVVLAGLPIQLFVQVVLEFKVISPAVRLLLRVPVLCLHLLMLVTLVIVVLGRGQAQVVPDQIALSVLADQGMMGMLLVVLRRQRRCVELRLELVVQMVLHVPLIQTAVVVLAPAELQVLLVILLM